ncbi:MAG TPA: CBS domain-containing protein [Nitrospirota bacterium]
MEICNACPSISGEDLQAALRELKTYVDVTEEDLLSIYALAVRHARKRRSTMVSVRTVMAEKVVSATGTMSLQDAARLLSVHTISGMPVVDADNRVIGVISVADLSPRAGKGRPGVLKDLLRRFTGKPALGGRDGEHVEDVMSAPPITIEPEADIKEVAAVLDMRRIKRLPVVDREGRLLGIISRGDVIRAMGEGKEKGALRK